jgi:thiosulfate/3-mercaptopyruvate sulfurtransferase
LNHYGHYHVRVLDGGLREWQREGRPLSTEIPAIEPAAFVPNVQPGWLATKRDVCSALNRQDTLLIDCLTPDLSRGSGDRHLWGQRPGHIPGAVNVPYLANVDRELATATSEERERVLASGRSFTFSPRAELCALYKSAGVTPERRVITYCGRGYAGACGLLALKALGHDNAQLYDGSWTEWSADPNLPVEINPDPVQ